MRNATETEFSFSPTISKNNHLYDVKLSPANRITRNKSTHWVDYMEGRVGWQLCSQSWKLSKQNSSQLWQAVHLVDTSSRCCTMLPATPTSLFNIQPNTYSQCLIVALHYIHSGKLQSVYFNIISTNIYWLSSVVDDEHRYVVLVIVIIGKSNIT